MNTFVLILNGQNVYSFLSGEVRLCSVSLVFLRNNHKSSKTPETVMVLSVESLIYLLYTISFTELPTLHWVS